MHNSEDCLGVRAWGFDISLILYYTAPGLGPQVTCLVEAERRKIRNSAKCGVPGLDSVGVKHVSVVKDTH